jgi:hypothetical protein
MRPVLPGIAEFFVSTIIRSSSLEMFMLATQLT